MNNVKFVVIGEGSTAKKITKDNVKEMPSVSFRNIGKSTLGGRGSARYIVVLSDDQYDKLQNNETLDVAKLLVSATPEGKRIAAETEVLESQLKTETKAKKRFQTEANNLKKQLKELQAQLAGADDEKPSVEDEDSLKK